MRFAIPTTPEACAHLARQQVVSQLRTRSEGLRASFTKPNAKARRENFGGSVIMCAGTSTCRVLLWERFTEWSGQIAAGMCDFGLWADVSRRVESAPAGRKSVDALEKRLRQVALRSPSNIVRAAVEAMRTRAADIYEHAAEDHPQVLIAPRASAHLGRAPLFRRPQWITPPFNR